MVLFRSDGGGNGFQLFSIHFLVLNLGLYNLKTLEVTVVGMRFLSSRYNFIFQKLAFFKYKITRSDE